MTEGKAARSVASMHKKIARRFAARQRVHAPDFVPYPLNTFDTLL
jgi:hypothetical protein